MAILAFFGFSWKFVEFFGSEQVLSEHFYSSQWLALLEKLENFGAGSYLGCNLGKHGQ